MISKYVNLYFPACSLILNIFLFIAFFSKKKVKTIDNKSYGKLLSLGLIESIFMFFTNLFVCFYFIPENYFIFEILNKVLYSIYILWLSTFFGYIYKIGENKGYKFARAICYIFDIVIITLIFISPIKLYYKNYLTNSYGSASNILYIGCSIYLVVMVILSIKKYVKMKSKAKYIPLLSLILMMGIMMIIRKRDPLFNISSNVFSFVELIMYFTIENPDLKMVNQLLRNKELVEEQMEDKSSFLFEMSQSVKMPAKNILELTKIYDKLDNDLDKKDLVRTIANNANELIFRTNNILDVSSMDASKIKIVTEEYNIYSLLEQIQALAKNNIKDKNIKLIFNVNKNIPKRLLGDSVRLKQVIMSILMNAIENTNKGSITLNIDSITRYDVARLIIRVEDTGIGLSLDEINKILSDSKELDNDSVEKLNDVDVDMPACIKIIKLLNGSINIRSDEKNGTVVSIVLDQLYKFDDLTEIEKQVEKYSSSVYGKKRLLIVDDDKEEIFKIKTMLSSYNYDINSSMIGKECIDRIRTGEVYDLILIDDELGNNSALNILNELKEMKYKVPVLVMLDKDKEHFKDDYIEEGFKGYILKKELKKELENKIDNYIR